MLETIQTNTLLNLSSVHLKERNYKISIELSQQVNNFKELIMDYIYSIYYVIKLIQINQSVSNIFLATKNLF